MVQAEKINRAGQIMDRGNMVIFKHIPENEQENFHNIENIGEAEHFFLKRNLFTEEKAQKLFLYFRILSEYREMDVQLQDIVINEQYHPDFYHFAIEQGILFVKEFIKNFFRESDSKQMANEIISSQINILNQNADAIISLDPTFSIEKSFFDETEFYTEAIDTFPDDILASFVLWKIKFSSNGRWFDFQKNTSEKLYRIFLQETIDIVEYSNYSDREKKIILNDFGRLTRFIFEERPSYTAFTFLALHYDNNIIDSQSINDNEIVLIGLLWMFGMKYKKMVESCMSLNDMFVLEKIFSHVVSLIEKMEMDNKLSIFNPNAEKIYGLGARVSVHLAELYPKLYEPSKSIDLCLHSLQKVNDFSQSDQIEAYDLIFEILKTLLNTDIDNAIIFAFNILNNESSYLQNKDINNPQNKSIKTGIEICIVNALIEGNDDLAINLIKKEENLKSDVPLLKCFIIFHKNLVLKDKIDEDSIHEIEKLLLEEYQLESSVSIEGLIMKIKNNNSDIETLKNDIEKLENLLKNNAN